jgi:hypothetical protein
VLTGLRNDTPGGTINVWLKPPHEASTVSDSEFPFRGDAPSVSTGSYGVSGLIAEAQRLIDEPPGPDGVPLAWYVKASHIGDLPAIAMAALREDGL